MLIAGPAQAAATTYVDEGAFLAALAAAGSTAVVESFEDEAAWGQVRTSIGAGTNTAAAVANLGMTWAPNNANGGVTTGGGPARSGSWGFFELPHGDYSDPANPITDGFVATTAAPIIGVGGWFSGQGTSAKVRFLLDGTVTVGFDATLLDSQHRFLGVIETQGFQSVEFYEPEGTAGDQNLIFVDDVTFGVPVSSTGACGNGTVDLGEQCDDGDNVAGDCCASDCAFETGACDDGDPCSTADACSTGRCVGGPPLNCDDGDPCSNDGCDTSIGCIYSDSTAACDDSDTCTTGDICSGGICAGHSVPGCGVTTSTTTTTSTSTTTLAPPTTTTSTSTTTLAPPTTTTSTSTTTASTSTSSTTSTTVAMAYLCGDATGDGAITASDALAVLRRAVGLAECDMLICDVDLTGTITTSDALRILWKAVGRPVELECSLGETTTTTLIELGALMNETWGE